jgi:hypothetical protein
MGGFNEADLIVYRNAVRGNLVDAMASVLRDMENLNLEFELQVPIAPKVANIGSQIFVAITFYIFVTFNQCSLVGQVFPQTF